MRAALTDWLDSRLGIRAAATALLARKIPAGTGWIYTLGSTALFLFVVQAITGTMLAMNYPPSPDHAYDAVRFIDDVTPLGRLVRGLHVWGASAMVVIVALHMLRTFVTGAYKAPRDLTWMSGVVLLVLVLAFGFTGYLLPWNQAAYWATSVGISIANQAPFVGSTIAGILRGGAEVGAQTLTRFFALHVLVLPAFTGALVFGHLFLVVRHGISAPPVWKGRAARGDRQALWREEQERYGALKDAGEPFYPFSLARDATTIAVVFAILVSLAFLRPPEAGEIADPTDATYTPRPEWYFLFLFQFLKYFPGWAEPVGAVVIPSLAILLLLALPLLDGGPLRHPFDRPRGIGLATLVVVGIAGLTFAGARSPLLMAYVPEPPQVADGSRLYRELHCASCHSIRGVGGVVGPDLAIAVPGHDVSWTVAHFKNPGGAVPGGSPHPTGLLDDEIADLAAFIDEVRGGGPYSEQAPRMFRRYCSECHKLAGRGGDKGPDLAAIGRARDRSFLHRYIENPRALLTGSKMPAFIAPEGPLSHQQVEDIARYLAAQRGP